MFLYKEKYWIRTLLTANGKIVLKLVVTKSFITMKSGNFLLQLKHAFIPSVIRDLFC